MSDGSRPPRRAKRVKGDRLASRGLQLGPLVCGGPCGAGDPVLARSSAKPSPARWAALRFCGPLAGSRVTCQRRSAIALDHNRLSRVCINRSVDAKRVAHLHLLADERAKWKTQDDYEPKSERTGLGANSDRTIRGATAAGCHAHAAVGGLPALAHRAASHHPPWLDERRAARRHWACAFRDRVWAPCRYAR